MHTICAWVGSLGLASDKGLLGPGRSRPGQKGGDGSWARHGIKELWIPTYHCWGPAIVQLSATTTPSSLATTLPPHMLGDMPIWACHPRGGMGHGRLAANPKEGAGLCYPLGKGLCLPPPTPGSLPQLGFQSLLARGRDFKRLAGWEGGTLGGWSAGRGWLCECTDHQGATPALSICSMVVSMHHSDWSFWSFQSFWSLRLLFI